MSSQISNNNIYTTAPASLNPYISRKLNNMNEVQVMKKEKKLDEIVLQDIEGVRNDDQCAKNGEGYEEDG